MFRPGRWDSRLVPPVTLRKGCRASARDVDLPGIEPGTSAVRVQRSTELSYRPVSRGRSAAELPGSFRSQGGDRTRDLPHVDLRGFEPRTSCMPCRRATKLRHKPM